MIDEFCRKEVEDLKFVGVVKGKLRQTTDRKDGLDTNNPLGSKERNLRKKKENIVEEFTK